MPSDPALLTVISKRRSVMLPRLKRGGVVEEKRFFSFLLLIFFNGGAGTDTGDGGSGTDSCVDIEDESNCEP